MSIMFFDICSLNFPTANFLFFFQIKLPRTTVRTFRTIRIAAQATAFEAVINRRRKTAVLINAYRLARMIRQTLAAACRLYAAVTVAVNEPVAVTNTLMLVQIAIEAIVQRLHIKWMQANRRLIKNKAGLSFRQSRLLYIAKKFICEFTFKAKNQLCRFPDDTLLQ